MIGKPNIDPIETIGNDLRKLQLKPNALKGQNFLKSKPIRNHIIENAQLTKTDMVIEIGAGTGILTHAIGQIAQDVYAFELDYRLADLLSARFSDNTNIHVINADGLAFDSYINLLRPFKVVANLPYKISTPFLMKLSSTRIFRVSCIVMIQKDVALRVVSPIGSSKRGVLTVIMQIYFQHEMIVSVPPKMFIPAPEVESQVIKLTPHKDPPEISWNLLVQTVKLLFSSKRKTILNNLRKKMGKSDALDLLDKCHINGSLRAEDLQNEQFIQLAEEFYGNVKS